MATPPPSQLRAQAMERYQAGRFREAIQLQVRLVNALAAANGAPTRDYQVLALLLSHVGQHGPAAAALEFARAREPENAQVRQNLGICLARCGRAAEARAELEQALAHDPEDANVHDALAEVCADLGDADAMRRHGERALLLKDARAAREPAHPLPDRPAPPFRHGAPERNAISFSLWGTQARYVEGALENAELIPVIYPGWSARFYCARDVPESARAKLERAGAQLILRDPPARAFEGLFWRFEVAEDPRVERFAVRDCDAVVNVQERVAVDAWIESGRLFHVMRDAVSHTELILAGLWGGVGGVLPPLGALRAHFRPEHLETRHVDQHFLRTRVWPTVRQSCLIHDRCFRVLGSEPFPSHGRLPPERHVGECANRRGGRRPRG